MVNKLIADGSGFRSGPPFSGAVVRRDYKEDKPLLVANLKKMIRVGFIPNTCGDRQIVVGPVMENRRSKRIGDFDWFFCTRRSGLRVEGFYKFGCRPMS